MLLGVNLYICETVGTQKFSRDPECKNNGCRGKEISKAIDYASSLKILHLSLKTKVKSCMLPTVFSFKGISS